MTQKYLSIKYIQSSPFSLRPSDATAKVGTTHLCPTPHCIKSAMINVYASSHTENETIEFLKRIDSLAMFFLLPENIVVGQGFYRLLKPPHDKESSHGEAFQSTIIYKEYTSFKDITIMFNVTSLNDSQIQEIAYNCACINYFGKKDSLIAYESHEIVTELPDHVIQPISIGFSNGMVIGLDDFYQHRKANSEKEFLASLRDFGGYGNKGERDKIQYSFPYRLKSSARNYTSYTYA